MLTSNLCPQGEEKGGCLQENSQKLMTFSICHKVSQNLDSHPLEVTHLLFLIMKEGKIPLAKTDIRLILQERARLGLRYFSCINYHLGHNTRSGCLSSEKLSPADV